MEAEYVATCEAAKEAIWLCKFLKDLEVVLDMNKPLTLYEVTNSKESTNSKEPRSHKRCKHIERKDHLIKESDVAVLKIASKNNLVDPFTKMLPTKSFEGRLEGLGLRDMSQFF